ncbi:MAG: DUF4199 domain-containing protein [Bacteroidetes bacterium]|nr:DUF4199 domain-containing protein [Bacteroidota bacterium]
MEPIQDKKINIKELLNNSHRYGLTMGGILIALGMLYYVMDVNMLNIGFSILNFVINMGVIITGMVLATIKFRDKYMDGNIKYANSFLSAWITAFVALLISGLFVILFYWLFDNQYMPKQIEEFGAMMEGKMSEDQLSIMMERMQEGIQPLNQLKNTLLASLVESGILALIVSAFIRKKDNSFESNFR